MEAAPCCRRPHKGCPYGGLAVVGGREKCRLSVPARERALADTTVRHGRGSLRLDGYDYAKAGACHDLRKAESLFGEVTNGTMPEGSGQFSERGRLAARSSRGAS